MTPPIWITVTRVLLSGEYSNQSASSPSIQASAGLEDVSEDVASELRRRCDLQMREVPAALYDFVDPHTRTRDS